MFGVVTIYSSVSELLRHIWDESQERLSQSNTITGMEDDMTGKKLSIAEENVRIIRRKTRKKYSGQENIRTRLKFRPAMENAEAN